MRLYIIIFISLLISFSSYSQGRQDRRDKIKSLKIAFITEKLNLSQQEAQKFWPIYNAFEDKTEAIRMELQQLRRSINMEAITEAEAKDVLDKIYKLELNRLNERQEFVKKLQSAISAKKILKLKEAEENFNRRMIEELRKRRMERRGN